MADEVQLRRIKRGVVTWNLWREKNPKIIPDLSDAVLKGANLREANLRRADLSRADLSEADLRWAYLRGADLTRAYLRWANLHNVDLREADLTRADLTRAGLTSASLSDAVLREADLSEAVLSGAVLGGADLSKAKIGWTIFTNIDLSIIQGLETVEHNGPSSIGIDTLVRSGGQIPEAFLRNCGLSDWQIEVSKLHSTDVTNHEVGDILYGVHDLRAQRPLQISPLFISYTHADGAFVDQIERRLTEGGIRFWRDVRHATSGRLETQIDRAIRLHPTVLLVLSENSVRSDWVEHEARSARKLEKEIGRDVLCPVALDGSWKECPWPDRLREQITEYNILDFSNWRDDTHFGRMYSKLVEGLDLFYKGKNA